MLVFGMFTGANNEKKITFTLLHNFPLGCRFESLLGQPIEDGGLTFS
jgi:hypothetical protein